MSIRKKINSHNRPNKKGEMNMTDETLEMIEQLIVEHMQWLEEHPIDDEHRNEVIRELEMLLEKRSNIDRTNLEYFDKEERRRIEQERNEATKEIEEKKQGINWKRAAFELAKVTVPTVIGAILYSKESDKMYEFEETGRVNSTAGRRHTNVLTRFLKW